MKKHSSGEDYLFLAVVFAACILVADIAEEFTPAPVVRPASETHIPYTEGELRCEHARATGGNLAVECRNLI